MPNANDQYLDVNGFIYFWGKLKDMFVRKDGDKVLSDNNFSDEEKEKLAQLEPGDSAASLLTQEEIPGTVQRYTFEGDGSIRQIEHVRDNQAIRTDTFVFGENLITETRVLPTGERLVIVTNLETMETTTTYTEGLTDGN